MDLTKVFDSQQNKTVNMHPKRALFLCTAYSSRFTFANASEKLKTQNYIEMEKNIMPHALPPESVNIKDGTYNITTIENKVTNGKYGEQEEITCITSDGEKCRVWVSMNSRKSVDAAAKAGIVQINPDTSWDVILGAQCQMIIVGGKTMLAPVVKQASK